MSDSLDDIKNSSKFSALETIKEEGKQKKEKRKDDIGILGSFFGSSKNAPVNISGALILFLLLFIAFCTVYFSNDFDKLKVILNVSFPIITLALGYIFGRTL